MRKKQRVTIADIARLAGVSAGAVSFALNGKAGVSEVTRRRILEVAATENWRPNSSARALTGGRVNVVGFVVNRPARSLGTEAFFAEMISGIQSGLAGSHTAMHMLVVPSLADELKTYQEWWNSQRVDGVILLDPCTDDPRLELLASLGLNAVLIGSHPAAAGTAASVWVDDTLAAETLFGYLGALGHRRIAHITGNAEFEHSALRAAVLKRSQVQYGLETTATIPTTYQPEQAERATRQLLSQPVRPTAIVYDNDVMAVAGLGVVLEMGLTVPGDVSIATFDDSVLARLVRPSITSLTRDTFELGELAAATLLAQIDAPTLIESVAAPQPTLTVRDSTSPPR